MMSPFTARLIACVHAMKQALKPSGSISENTLRNVSWLGIPFGSSRRSLNHSNFAKPKSSMSTKLVAPHITAHTEMNRMSINKCRFCRSTRGSGSSPKCSRKPVECTISTSTVRYRTLQHPPQTYLFVTHVTRRMHLSQKKFPCVGPGGEEVGYERREDETVQAGGVCIPERSVG